MFTKCSYKNIFFPFVGSIALMEMSHRLHSDYFEEVLSRAMQGCRDIEVFISF